MPTSRRPLLCTSARRVEGRGGAAVVSGAVPSSFEAAGIAYLEAMRVGLPVIATTAGGAAELVDDSVAGFLVAPGDVGALADRLGRWVTDRALLTSLVDRRQQTTAREAAP